MAWLKTVKIQEGKEFRIINAEDYNPKVHQLFNENPALAPLPLEDWSLSELKSQAKSLGLEGAAKMTKTRLIQAITQAQKNPPTSREAGGD
ncbi:MAG: Rho termination factor N-terminal domain-containing protein [bacterium]|nr:Rho termination factor N-terminal domain-containing protein [bacterium]